MGSDNKMQDLLSKNLAQAWARVVELRKRLPMGKAESPDDRDAGPSQGEQLSEHEERYRSVFQTSLAVMLLVDPESGRIVDANPAACAFYGYPREDCRSLSLDQISVLDGDDLRARLAEAAALRQNRFEFRHRLSSGELKDVEVYSGPVRVEGRLLLHSIVHDITER
jgi:PAS domain S-box-containing protein